MPFTFKLKKYLKDHTGAISSLAIFKNSNRIVSGSRDNTIKVWNLDNDEVETTFEGHTFWVNDVDISPEEDLIVSGGWDFKVKLWDLNKKELKFERKDHHNDVLAVRFIPGKKLIISSGRDNQLCVSKLDGNQSDKYFNSTSNWVTSISFVPNNNDTFICSTWDKKLLIMSYKRAEIIHELIGHTSFVECIDISKDGTLCVSGARDGICMLWDIKERRFVQFIDTEDHIRSVKIDNKNQRVFILSTSSVCILDLTNMKIEGKVEPPKDFDDLAEDGNEFLSMAYNEETGTLFTGCTDGVIYIWNILM